MIVPRTLGKSGSRVRNEGGRDWGERVLISSMRELQL